MKLLEALVDLFGSPEYSDRIPQAVRTKIASNGFGSVELDTDTANEIFSVLQNKWARQDLYSFTFEDTDLTRFDKGYLAFGDIIEDDYIDVATARQFPAIKDGGTVDPFKINLPKVKPSYYIGTFTLQYWTTTRTMEVKKAFMSENACNNFISRARNVLPESLKLDRFLIIRYMLASMPYAQTVNIEIAQITNENDLINHSLYVLRCKPRYRVKMASKALAKSNKKYNKLGVMNSTPKSEQILFINAGVRALMSSILYNTYHNNIDFEIPSENIIEISGFGSDGADKGLWAVLVDGRQIKAYTTENPDLENIYNPAGKYWNTWLTYQGKISYALHASSVAFTMSEKAGE